VSVLFGSIILLRHDGAALWAVIGSISNSALSVVLKRILNQERPTTTLRSDPGMPSSHAQSISFISVFAVLSGKQLKLFTTHRSLSWNCLQRIHSSRVFCSYGMAWNQRCVFVS